MSHLGSWLGSGAALIVLGLCWLLMHHLHHLPAMTHPWLHRLLIIGMYCAGSALIVTSAGSWLLALIRHVTGMAGGTAPHSGAGWAAVTIAGLFLIAALIVALIWVPKSSVAWVALVTPLVLALAVGGIAHKVYVATAYPASTLVQGVATWAGG